MVSTHRKIFVKLKFTSPNFRVENSQNLSNHHLLVQTIQRSLKLPTPNTAFKSGNPWNLYHICLLLLWSNSSQNGSHLMTNVPFPTVAGPVASLRFRLQGATFIGHELWGQGRDRLQTWSFWGISHAASQKPCVLFFLIESKHMRWSMPFWGKVLDFLGGRVVCFYRAVLIVLYVFFWFEIMNRFF